MKLLKKPLVYALLIVSIYSFTNKNVPPSLPLHPDVGDVVYSILQPTLFKVNHSGRWELLDGAPLDSTTRLYKQLKSSSSLNILQTDGNDRLLPNASGVFIRSMNNKRDAATGNPDGDKQVGTYQPDVVGPHSHGWTGASGNGYPSMEYRRWDTPAQMADPKYIKYVCESKYNYELSGIGKETRPRNISLYVYIKISD